MIFGKLNQHVLKPNVFFVVSVFLFPKRVFCFRQTCFLFFSFRSGPKRVVSAFSVPEFCHTCFSVFHVFQLPALIQTWFSVFQLPALAQTCFFCFQFPAPGQWCFSVSSVSCCFCFRLPRGSECVFSVIAKRVVSVFLLFLFFCY